MYSCISLNHYPDEFIQPELLPFWSQNKELVVHTLLHGKDDRFRNVTSFSRNLFVYPSEYDIKELELRGNKSKGSVGGNSGKSSQPGGIQWLNVPLDSSDVDDLERDASTLEYLAAALVGLVGDGYGISVKYQAERKSYSCTIYRPDTGGGSGGYGVSGFAPDVRDAVLVTLFKFERKLGGEFPTGGNASPFLAQSKRFG